MTLTNSLVKRGMGLIEYWNRNHQAAIIQEEYQLSQLLKQAQFTDFGKTHQFSVIQNNNDLTGVFQSKVPLHNYQEMFDPWWKRSFEGCGDVHWKGQTKYFALSSGTSDAASKYIPITADMTRSMRSGALRMFSCLPKYQLDSKLYFRDWLMIGSSAKFVNKERSEIVITGRTKHFLSICGEHLSVDNMNQAIIQIGAQMQVDI